MEKIQKILEETKDLNQQDALLVIDGILKQQKLAIQAYNAVRLIHLESGETENK
jgi:hypothetical protein